MFSKAKQTNTSSKAAKICVNTDKSTMKTSSEREAEESKSLMNRTSNDPKSRIPSYTANGNVSRQRRHSDGPQSTPHYHNVCQIHGNQPFLHQFYGYASEPFPTSYVLPQEIRALHNSHQCSNRVKSRSVPGSHLVSTRTSPASTPSTPTDSRRMPLSRKALTPNSTPSRSASKSSLSMASQMTRSSVQKNLSEYMPLCEVQKGLQKGDIIEGVLRINPRNYSDAYISTPEGGLDLYVGGMIDRNRALNGDRVAVKVKDIHHWKILHDIIRTHWDEWGEQLEEIVQSSKRQLKPNNAQNKFDNNDTIYENDESFESHECVRQRDDISHNDSNDNNQSLVSINNEVIDANDEIDKSEPFDLTNMGAALHSNDGINKNKKRKRSRKKKSSRNKGSEVEKNVESKARVELSCPKPEILEMTQTKKVNHINKKRDELSKKVGEIQSLNVENLIGLSFWRRFIQRTAFVVYIVEMNHSRQAGGHLLQMKDKSTQWALFVPNDSRVPRMRIPMQDCPQDFLYHPQHFSHSLFIAKLDKWDKVNGMPTGMLVKHLGNAGDIEAESEMLLMENNVDFQEFPDQAFHGLPNIIEGQEWKIPDEEIQQRRDFRQECVFTIDPSTARDLDDALSIKQLDADRFEMGVHIADVTYFLKEGMPLDEIARSRTTSVYLIQSVIPMLPRILCEKLCSLNAGEDKLTFSVVWIIDKDGDVLEEWFGRTLINSCVKLSYELAQDMIDDPHKQWTKEELPQIYGKWNYKKISESVNLLNKIAVKLRKSRFDRGALKIDKLKLHFILDKETGLPSGFSPYIYRDSNRLVEEFMLLANMAVARKIYKSFDDKAFLRCHPEPGENPLNDFKSFCKYNNFQVDTSTSLKLQQSLDSIVGDNEDISKVVAHYLLKAMQMANYICVGMQSASASFHHYALNVPLYTHFTSPIRRYADVIVHRLLAASLKYRKLIHESTKDIHRLAQKCNEKKLNARIVSESSAKLFLHLYIKQIGKMDEKAIVVQVFDHSFDVMLLNCGVICRIYLDQLPVKEFIFQTRRGKNEITIKWDTNVSGNTNVNQDLITQTITACLIVKVQVSVSDDDSMKLNTILQHPSGIFTNKNDSKGFSNVEIW